MNQRQCTQPGGAPGANAPRQQRGLSMIELMIALVVGLIVVAGMLQVFVSSKGSSEMNSGQMELIENARFSLHTLRRDALMTGSWGRLTRAQLVEGRRGSTAELPSISGDCAAGWYVDVERRLFASDDSNPYASTCLGSSAEYRAGTDVLVLRYAQAVEIADANLLTGTTYLRSSPMHGTLFDGGDALPTVFSGANYPLQSVVYYVANYSERAGDGIPSLRRKLLVGGPKLEDELVAAGVEDFQVQFGVDLCQPRCDEAVDLYVDADNPVLDWGDADMLDRVLAVRVFLLVRSGDRLGESTQTFTLGSKSVTTADDGYRRMLLSSVFFLRNKSYQ